MSTATMPRRITTFQYLRAAAAVRLGLEPDPEGATVEWADALRAGLTERPAASRADRIATAFIEPVRRPARRPVAAIAATPHQETVCPLDACPLDLGPLEPAVLFDADRYALIGTAA